MYHAVTRARDDFNNIYVSPERFEAQMLYLERRNLKGVSIRELRREAVKGSARGLVGLTFDDGYENFLHTAVPVLEKFGFSATVFVLAGMFGGENSWDRRPRLKLLDVEGVRKVSERGMEVGSHGLSHIKLSGLNPEQLEHEVRSSRQVLSEVLGEAVEGFCYPYGNLDGRSVDAVRRTGYSYACAYKERISWDSYDLPRVYVGERDNVSKLRLKLWLYWRYRRFARILR
jgi:peptidoglycan/xylan/chitin deacetylase (PgdA/CDA1 family)